jgi:hypothetical protein
MTIKFNTIKWVTHVGCIGEMRNAYSISITELERPRHSWEDNINTDLGEIGCKGMDWIEVAQDEVQWHIPLSLVHS